MTARSRFSGNPATAIPAMALAISIFLVPTATAESAISISLEEACGMSLRHSVELKAARLRILSEERRIGLTLWDYAPTLNLSLTDSRTTRYGANDTDTITTAASLSVPISRGGRRGMNRNLARLNLDAQYLLVTESEDGIRDACFQAFFGAHLLQLETVALREQEAITASHCAIAQKEFELGMITEIDLIETRLKNSLAAQDLFSAETELLSLEYSLKKITGLAPGAKIALKTGIDGSYTGLDLRSSVDALKKEALEGNASLIQGRYGVEELRITDRISGASWLPDVDLEATMQMSGDGYPLQRPNWGLRARCSFPFSFMPVTVSFGLSTNPGIEYGRSASSSARTSDSLEFLVDEQLARIAMMEALEGLSSLEKDILFQLEQALLNYERLAMEQRLAGDNLRLQERRLAILSVQLELGQITRLEYLEGTNDFLNSRLRLYSGIRSLMEAERTIEDLAGIRAGELALYGGKDGA